MDESPDTIIRRELGPHEELRWSGQPRQGIFLRPADALLIPFSLMWGGFTFFWEYSVVHDAPSGGASTFMMLWGIPFVVAGIYIIIGRFFVDAQIRARTAYGVTNERAVIASGLFSRSVKSFQLRSLVDTALVEKADGTGTIVFGKANPLSTWTTGFAWPGLPQIPSFERIPNVRAVHEIIRGAHTR